MTRKAAPKQQYMVSIYEPEDGSGTLVFTFEPEDPGQERVPGRPPKRPPQFIVSVRPTEPRLTFDWTGSSDDPGAARREIEKGITTRIKMRKTWIDRVGALVDRVEQWAKEMDWSTRRIEKRIDDAQIGKHRVPALLMQYETCRALLEPIGPSAPGAEGVVDLYLMPAYDDIARLYFYAGRWYVRFHALLGSKDAPPASEVEAVALSKETLEKVLAEMKQHAA
jgi:hypothetical protein